MSLRGYWDVRENLHTVDDMYSILTLHELFQAVQLYYGYLIWRTNLLDGLHTVTR